MTARTASCPSCGAPLVFRSAATTMAVCGSCGVGAWRTDVSVESLGKVSEVVEIQSIAGLGARGKTGGKSFVVLGQLQLDHGSGPWNEWYIEFEDRTNAWLAEAQGQIYLTQEVAGFEPPRSLELRPGQAVRIAGAVFSVAEAGTARVVAARGELPSPLAAGDEYRYLDVRGTKSRFGTISGNPRTKRVEAFVGTEIQPAAIEVDRSTLPPPPPRRVRTDRFACPQCGSALRLRDPQGAARLVCESCGSLIDPTSERVRVVGKGMELESRPKLPLGTTGTLRGEEMTVLAYLVRSVTSDGVRYPWSEYLLRTKDGAYRWLVVSKGHWILATPANPADWLVGGYVRQGLHEYRHFQGGEARVDHVQGEIYWAVRVGDMVDADDFVCVDPATGVATGLSRERSPGEVVCSTCERVPREEILAAFGKDLELPPERGVAMLSPNPWVVPLAGARKVAGILAGLFVAAWIAIMAVLPAAEVARLDLVAVWDGAPDAPAVPDSAQPTPDVGAAAAERGVAFSPEFELTASSGNVVVDVEVHDLGLERPRQLGGWDSIRGTWLGVDGALVNVETGDVRAFAVEAERWSGIESGESWTEGSGRGEVRIGEVPAGRYSMRLESVWSGMLPPADPAETRRGAAVVRAQVPSPGLPWVVLVLVLLPAVLVWFASRAFETARWAESDHAE